MEEYPMRRKDRALSAEETLKVLEQGEYGVLSTVGADGQPYGIPISYVVWNGYIYVHCAPAGRKVDNLAFEPRVCFSVIGPTKPVYDKGFSTYYESAAVFGTAALVEDRDESVEALTRLARKYLPEHMDKAGADIARSFSRTAVYRFSMDAVSGKAKKPKA